MSGGVAKFTTLTLTFGRHTIMAMYRFVLILTCPFFVSRSTERLLSCARPATADE